MAKFDPAYLKMIKNEGGYSNDPHDRGGETYRGISRKNWPDWEGWKDVDRILMAGLRKALDQDESLQEKVCEFYRRNFWLSMYDEIESQELADWLFDKAVNVGKRTVNRWLQAALGVIADGIIGPETWAALKAETDIPGLIGRLKLAAEKHYRRIVERIPSQRIFLKGWLARIER